MTSQITYRTAETGDHTFILHSWYKSFLVRNSFIKKCVPDVVYEFYLKRQIEKHIYNGKILIACATDDPEIILGYAIYDNETIHYVYIKRSYRNLNIAKTLIGIILNEAKIPLPGTPHNASR